jgi:TrpR-related protein YerC/YecD
MDSNEDQLYQAILGLKSIEECRMFFKDLCTPKEIKDMKDRLMVAQLLSKGGLSYREIHDKTKVSLTTITRVARFLTQEPYQGYNLVLSRKNEKNITINNRDGFKLTRI